MNFNDDTYISEIENSQIKDVQSVGCVGKERSGFEPIPQAEQICISPDHQPPTHLYIPPGQQYRHVCSGCGKTIIMRPLQVSW